MFNFNERTMGEKVVMVGAAALVIGNTVVNAINAVKIKNVKKRFENVGNFESSDNNQQPQDNQQPQQ